MYRPSLRYTKIHQCPCLPDAPADGRNRGRTSYGHLSRTALICLFLAFSLTNCAEAPVKQRPGVLEAKSCLAHIHKSPPTFDGYIIQSCTNTGVWLVEQRDVQSGQLIALYDFVNREYTQGSIEAEPLTMDLMTEPEKTEFLTLQRNLNKALLNEGKS